MTVYDTYKHEMVELQGIQYSREKTYHRQLHSRLAQETVEKVKK